ncbi:hypothetical protein DFH07DRAFT_763750 [Mycena maculata]|uniref:Uncharacterized protein n=1 Tax=Mycena maculata TaxID=230809 RepID=A0AAD7KGJ3_9AGAR|nr:hypothetical protein DFH07DRAFT_763750 [Mycena maculata]
MLALRFVSLFLLSATVMSASPAINPGAAAARKRALTAFNTLKGSADAILPQITALVSGGTASDATVTPLINDLTSALDTATASLAALPASGTSKRQTEDDIAILAAGIVTVMNSFPLS